ASSQGLRAGAAVAQPARERRQAAIYTLLANASRPGFGWQSVRLFLGSMLRALGLLLGKAPADAWDEVVGTIRAYARPLRMLHARRVRRSTAELKPAEVRHLLPATWWPYQHGLDLAVETVRAVVRPQPAVAARRALVEP